MLLLRHRRLCCLVLRCLLLRPGRLRCPGLVGLGRLPLPAVTATWIVTVGVLAGTVAARLRLTARLITLACGAWVTAVPACLTGLSMDAAVPCPRLLWADRCEVRELPLVLRRGVIPLVFRRAIVLARPAATRSAGE